jgi:hypothetical protein
MTKPIYCWVPAGSKRVVCEVIKTIPNRERIMQDLYVRAVMGHPFDGQRKIIVNESKVSYTTQVQS